MKRIYLWTIRAKKIVIKIGMGLLSLKMRDRGRERGRRREGY